MRELFTIDTKDYVNNGYICIRPSARGIIIRNNKVAMVYSKKYNYYEFPGGGIKNNETPVDAMIREVKEETGLNIINSLIKEFGICHCIQKGDPEDIFIQDNYFYIASVTDKIDKTCLDDYEKEEEYQFVFVDALTAIKNNRSTKYRYFDSVLVERDAKILELLIKEKYIK